MKVTTIGDIKDQVTISSITYTDDGMGGVAESTSTIGTYWAQVTAPSTSDGVVAGADSERRTHVVRVRQDSSTFGITINSTVSWRSQTLTVKGVRPFGRTWVDLDCQMISP